jgi:hypothetical protein
MIRGVLVGCVASCLSSGGFASQDLGCGSSPPRHPTLTATDLLKKIPPVISASYQALAPTFLAKAKSEEGLTPKDWFDFLTRVSYEVRSFVTQFKHPTRDHLFLRTRDRYQPKAMYDLGWPVYGFMELMGANREVQVGRGWAANWVNFLDMFGFKLPLTLPRHLMNDHHLSDILLQITDMARRTRREEIQGLTRDVWLPIVFQKREALRRVLLHELTQGEPLFDLELAQKLSVLGLPIPEALQRRLGPVTHIGGMPVPSSMKGFVDWLFRTHAKTQLINDHSEEVLSNTLGGKHPLPKALRADTDIRLSEYMRNPWNSSAYILNHWMTFLILTLMATDTEDEAMGLVFGKDVAQSPNSSGVTDFGDVIHVLTDDQGNPLTVLTLASGDYIYGFYAPDAWQADATYLSERTDVRRNLLKRYRVRSPIRGGASPEFEVEVMDVTGRWFVPRDVGPEGYQYLYQNIKFSRTEMELVTQIPAPDGTAIHGFFAPSGMQVGALQLEARTGSHGEILHRYRVHRLITRSGTVLYGPMAVAEAERQGNRGQLETLELEILGVRGQRGEDRWFIPRTQDLIDDSIVRSDIKGFVREKEAKGRAFLEYRLPEGTVVHRFDLGSYSRTGGLIPDPNTAQAFEAFVIQTIENRYRGQTVFENMAHAQQTRHLSYQIGKRLGLWVYFPPDCEELGLTYDNHVLHGDRWSLDVFLKLFDGLVQDPELPLPHFLTGNQQRRWREIANPPPNVQLSGEEQRRDVENRRQQNRAYWTAKWAAITEIVSRPVFQAIKTGLKQDEQAFQNSQTYSNFREMSLVAGTLYLTSKARWMGSALTRAGIIPAGLATTALFSVPGLIDSAIRGLELSGEQRFRNQDAFLTGWQQEYDVFKRRLQAVHAMSLHPSEKPWPLVKFLEHDHTQSLMLIPQLRATGQGIATLLVPEVRDKIRLCLNTPDRFLAEWNVEVQSQIPGFMREALGYPTLCEMLGVLTTEGNFLDLSDPTFGKTLTVQKRLKKIVINAPSGTDGQTGTPASAVGSFSNGVVVLTPRVGWNERVKFYVFAEELWHAFFDHTLVNHKARLPSQEHFVRAAVMHEYLAHLIQVFVMKETEDQGLPLMLWINNTVHTLNRIRNDAETLQASWETSYMMHALEVLPESVSHGFVYGLYQNFYRNFR